MKDFHGLISNTNNTRNEVVVSMQKRVPEEIVDRVRKANDIVDVVGEFVQLKRQGRNFFGLCPFHDEQTPSFSVTQDKQIFYCFGCKKGGNVISFLMELENYTFFEALRFLAERGGVELPAINQSEETATSKISQDILSANEWLTKLYHHLLKYTKDGKDGYKYFKQRGISDESIDAFQLGYAPNSRNFTADFLNKKGFDQHVLIKGGLITLQAGNEATDPFRGRVIFPIRNHLGKTVAFGGRTITDAHPKYINSSENELFQKSKLLYNFDLARKHIRKENEVVLFEGQMDVISAYQAGVKHAVATLGTSLTDFQARLLKRYVDVVVICYDGDKAGLEATYRAASLLRKTGSQVKIALLSDGYDPDGYIKEYGAQAFQRLIDNSDTFISFYMQYLKKDYNMTNESDRLQYIQKVVEQLAKVNSYVEREYYLRDLSKEYHLSLDTLTKEVDKQRQKQEYQKDKRGKNRYTSTKQPFYQEKKLLPAFHNAERRLIAYMLQDQSIADRVQHELGIDLNIDDHKIIVTHLYGFYEEGNEPDVSLFVERVPDERLKQLVIEIAITSVGENISDEEISDYIRTIRSHAQAANIQTYKQQQKMAEKQNDPIKAAEIAMQMIELKKQLKNIK